MGIIQTCQLMNWVPAETAYMRVYPTPPVERLHQKLSVGAGGTQVYVSS